LSLENDPTWSKAEKPRQLASNRARQSRNSAFKVSPTDGR
jgi:hypothetical protein